MRKLLLFLLMGAFVGFASCEKEELSELYIFPTESEDSGVFYLYYRLVNKSGRLVDVDFNDGGCIILGERCEPGSAVVYSMRSEFRDDLHREPSFGSLGLLGFVFDPKSGIEYFQSTPAIYFRDFDIEPCETPNPGDQTQWSYEKLDPLHARWTYVITDADYRYALAHPERPM